MRREFGGRSSSDSKTASKRSGDNTADNSLSPYHSHEDLSNLTHDDETMTQYAQWVEDLGTGSALTRLRALQNLQNQVLRLNPSFLLFSVDYHITILDQCLKLWMDEKLEGKSRKQALQFVVLFVLVCGDDRPELYDRTAKSLLLDVLLHPMHQPTKKKGRSGSQEDLLIEGWAAVALIAAANEKVVIDDQPLSSLLLNHEQSPLKPGNPVWSKHAVAAALAASSVIDISQRRALKTFFVEALKVDSSSPSSPTSPNAAVAELPSSTDGKGDIPYVSFHSYLWTGLGVLEDRFHGSFTEEGMPLLLPLAERATPDKTLSALQKTVLAQVGVDAEHPEVPAHPVAPFKKIQFRERHIDVIGFHRIYIYDLCRFFFGEMLLVHAAKNPTVRRVLHVTADVASKLSKEERELVRLDLQERLEEKEENLKERAKLRKAKNAHQQQGFDDE